MTSSRKLSVAIAGLGFGKEFIPNYQHRPDTSMYAICQGTREKLDETGAQYGVDGRYTSFEGLIADSHVDAVHINSPIHLHTPQAIRQPRLLWEGGQSSLRSRLCSRASGMASRAEALG